ncbi:hypothetical protein RGU70_13380 [Herbaspirillum sp. RTI4]|uniref:hypothetical protein n=1 Tax=Herbaspirillum sp. RTI4 TaxID=3048640 RepID=UPI002AB5504F|nr:hypothetical protein [Herbaspirillum sp. RTI4]MDY7579308.1 hypothetical protein [Herbaspirillum sp. RTI4]MEA9980221.1 hypothetical protein [Herbaspirillum sp. RTI4]
MTVTATFRISRYAWSPFPRSSSPSIDTCAAKARYDIKDCDVQLDGALFGRLTEAETATVVFTFAEKAGTSEEIVLATVERKVELLPRNQWGGLSHLPDLFAAFVQPNELAVDRLLKQTAEVLRKAGKSAAIDGYTGGAKRASELTSALWTAVAGLGLDYALPPASFEYKGQKVPSPAQVLDARIGTCLDLTLMFCAALEQAGLNSVVVFTKGHAFAGVTKRRLSEVRQVVRRHGPKTKQSKTKTFTAEAPKTVTGVIVSGNELCLPNTRHKKIWETRALDVSGMMAS